MCRHRGSVRTSVPVLAASCARRSRAWCAFLLKSLAYSLRNAETFEDLPWHDLMLADHVRMSTLDGLGRARLPRGASSAQGIRDRALNADRSRNAARPEQRDHERRVAARAQPRFRSTREGRCAAPRADRHEPRRRGHDRKPRRSASTGSHARRAHPPGRFELRVVPVSLEPEACIPFLHEQRMHRPRRCSVSISRVMRVRHCRRKPTPPSSPSTRGPSMASSSSSRSSSHRKSPFTPGQEQPRRTGDVGSIAPTSARSVATTASTCRCRSHRRPTRQPGSGRTRSVRRPHR